MTGEFNPLNAELNPTCHLLALLGAHHIFHVSGLRVNFGFYWCIVTHTVCVLDIKVFAKAAHYIEISFMTQHAVTLTSFKYRMKLFLLWRIFNDTEGKIISDCFAI